MAKAKRTTPRTRTASGDFAINNRTKQKAPAFPFADALSQILPGWEMSLVFVTPAEAKKLNVSLRAKDYTPNVLSYETGTKSGEVLICLSVAKEQAPEYELSYPDFVGFLFIHALLHLKGQRHGATMDKAEREWLSRIAPHTLHETTHRNRHRSRHQPD